MKNGHGLKFLQISAKMHFLLRQLKLLCTMLYCCKPFESVPKSCNYYSLLHWLSVEGAKHSAETKQQSLLGYIMGWNAPCNACNIKFGCFLGHLLYLMCTKFICRENTTSCILSYYFTTIYLLLASFFGLNKFIDSVARTRFIL